MAASKTSSTDEVDGVPINRKWFESVMKRALKTDATLVSARGHRVDEGQGFMSVIGRIDMDWEPAGSLLKRVVLKTPTASKVLAALQSMQAGGDEDKKVDFEGMLEKMKLEGGNLDPAALVHNNECAFYVVLTTNGTAPAPLPIPICYHYEMVTATTGGDPGVLLFEDLGERGKVPNFGDSLTIGQARAVFDALAHLHAWCFKNPKWFEDGGAPKERVHKKDELVHFYTMVIAGVASLKRLPISKDVVKLSDEDAKRLVEFESIWELLDPSKPQHAPAVLVHGDLWTQNIFFGFDKTTGKFTDELVAIIDWQTAHRGNCYEDMTRLMASSVNYELRRAHEDELIEGYYATLEGLLKGSGVAVPFSIDNLKRWYKTTLRLSIAQMAVHAPFMLAAPTTGDAFTDEQKLNLVWRVQGGIEDVL